MGNPQETLQQYVSDMISLDKHILDAVDRQIEDKRTSNYPETQQVLTKIQSTLKGHIPGLEQLLSNLGGDSTSPVKKAVSAVAGLAAGTYDKIRTDTVSKMLRDTYTAMSLSAISYTMLHTTGQALKHPQSAELAVGYLKQVTPLIVEISEVVPLVVAHEIEDTDPAVGKRAVKDTQKAWSHRNVR